MASRYVHAVEETAVSTNRILGLPIAGSMTAGCTIAARVVYAISNSIFCESFQDQCVKRGKMVHHKFVRVMAFDTIDTLSTDIRAMLAGDVTVIFCSVTMARRAVIVYIDRPSAPRGSDISAVTADIGAGTIVIIHRRTTT
jgi:hypothetical protein